MVILSYLAVDYFFVPPQHALGRPSHFDLVILVGFVVTSAVIAQLVISLRQSALVATERAAEIERLDAGRRVLEREASRAEVRQEAERLRNALLASLSHDLRSPIMVLTMLADPSSGVSPRDAMPRIADQVQQLSQFLSTISRFTTSGSIDSLLHLETHPAAELIGAALRASAVVLADRPVAVDDDATVSGRGPGIARGEESLIFSHCSAVFTRRQRQAPAWGSRLRAPLPALSAAT